MVVCISYCILTVPKINFVMLLVGCFECFAVGFLYRIEDQIASLGAEVVSSYITTTVRVLDRACLSCTLL